MHPNRREGDVVRENEREERESRINEKSYIQIGFVISLLALIAGAVWWASAMQSKMDQVIEEVKGSRTMQSKLGEYETRIKILELQIEQLKIVCNKLP